MNQVFWIGVYPGLTQAMLDYVLETINEIALKGHSLVAQQNSNGAS
jgi:dTDP-4-amino-4,6-dideoxygalactose transaminase